MYWTINMISPQLLGSENEFFVSNVALKWICSNLSELSFWKSDANDLYLIIYQQLWSRTDCTGKEFPLQIWRSIICSAIWMVRCTISDFQKVIRFWQMHTYLYVSMYPISLCIPAISSSIVKDWIFGDADSRCIYFASFIAVIILSVHRTPRSFWVQYVLTESLIKANW